MKKIIITLSILSAFAVSAIAQQERPARPERPDPAAMVTKLLADFDADGNGSLNEAELNKGLASLRPQGQQGRQNARPEGQRPQTQRPERAERPERPESPEAKGPQGDRPSAGNMGAMFLKRNDKDENGELNKKELTEAFKNMPQRGGQEGQRGNRRPQGDE
jgi:hypothetical protein